MSLVKDSPRSLRIEDHAIDHAIDHALDHALDAWGEDTPLEAAHWKTAWDVPNPALDSSVYVLTSSSIQGAPRIAATWSSGESLVGLHGHTTESTESLRHRLDNANNHFRRKAADVLGDEDAVVLLAEIYQMASIRIRDFDSCQHGIALAKLTAANFCEIGANLIYITEAGQSFIESINQR